jgi:Flp pilus assembly protein TadD
MLKRSTVVLSLTLMLVFTAHPTQPVYGVLMTPDEVAMANASSDAENKDSGNAFVRAISAPFKAIGKLFGAGKKDNKPHRLSEKDVKKFETTGTVRVVDATLVATPESMGLKTNPAAATDATATAPSKEELNKIQARQNVARARTMLDNNNINNEVFDLLNTAIKLDPKNGEAHNLLGIAYEAKGMRQWAFKSLETAVKYDSNQPEYLNNLGYLYLKNGEYDSAAKYLRRAVKISPQQQRYWNNLGLVEVQRENFDEAYNCFVRAVGEFEGHMNLANRLQARGYDSQAIRLLELARAIRPTSREILVRLISLYKRTGKTEQAAEATNSFVSLSTMAAAPNQ